MARREEQSPPAVAFSMVFLRRLRGLPRFVDQRAQYPIFASEVFPP